MLTIITGLVTSLIIAFSGSAAPCQPKMDKQCGFGHQRPGADIRNVQRPVEALGGGFKKHKR